MSTDVKFPLTSRNIALALVVFAVVVAGAGWFMLISPKRSQASKLAGDIQTKQTALAAAQHSAVSPGKPQAASMRSADKALPDAIAMPQVVDELSTLAQRANVTLDTVTPQTSVNENGYVGVPLNVVVDGHYFGVERFLRLVRTQVRLDKNHVTAAGRLLDVQGVQLQQTEPAPSVTATLSLRAFYYSPSSTEASATTTTDTTTTSG